MSLLAPEDETAEGSPVERAELEGLRDSHRRLERRVAENEAALASHVLGTHRPRAAIVAPSPPLLAPPRGRELAFYAVGLCLGLTMGWALWRA